MKKIIGIMGLLLCMGTAQPADAGLMQIIKDKVNEYKVGLPLKLRYDWVGARDLKNGEWLAGHSLDVLWLYKKSEGEPIIYLSANNLFNADHKGKGAFGVALGIETGGMGKTITKAAETFTPKLAPRLKWIESLSKYVTAEVGGGHKTWGVPGDQSKWYWTVGGKLKIPVKEFWDWAKERVK